jgi:hypothetical protein
MSSRRIGPGRVLTAVGAVLVIASLPMTWYHAERSSHTELTGWGIFTNLRVWLVVAAVLALATVLFDRGRLLVAVRAGLGLLAGGPVLRRVISPPDAAVPLDNRIGLYVALVGALAIIAGGLMSAGREAAEAMGWDLPGDFSNVRRLPPPSSDPSGGSAYAALPIDEPIVDADVIELDDRPGRDR